MMERSVEASPCPRARITGVVYLSYFLTAVCGEFLLKGLVVHGDAAATANNILAHQPLFRLGLATGLIATACYVAVTALFYGLFKAVNRSLSLLAASLASWDAPFWLSQPLSHRPACRLGRQPVLGRI